MHRVYLPDGFPDAGFLTISSDEARHALVKRLRNDEPVELLDGVGKVASARVVFRPSTPTALHVPADATSVSDRRGSSRSDRRQRREPEFEVCIDSVRREPPPRPAVHVWSAVPKGDALADMIDCLSQLGVAGWSPLETRNSASSGAAAPRTDRLQRVAIESTKQCGRAWLMRIDASPMRTLSDVWADQPGATPNDAAAPGPHTGERVDVVLACAGGGAFTPIPGAGVVRVLIGPEGGFTPQERQKAMAAGARACSFGAHVLRIETAAAAAAAIVLDACRRLT